MPVEAAAQFRAGGGERQLCRPTESPDNNVGDKGFQGWPTVAVLALVVALAAGSATTGLFFWLNEQDALFRDNPGVLSPGTLLVFLMQARLYAKFIGSNGCDHVGKPPLVAGVGGFLTVHRKR